MCRANVARLTSRKSEHDVIRRLHGPEDANALTKDVHGLLRLERPTAIHDAGIAAEPQQLGLDLLNEPDGRVLHGRARD